MKLYLCDTCEWLRREHEPIRYYPEIWVAVLGNLDMKIWDMQLCKEHCGTREFHADEYLISETPVTP